MTPYSSTITGLYRAPWSACRVSCILCPHCEGADIMGNPDSCLIVTRYSIAKGIGSYGRLRKDGFRTRCDCSYKARLVPAKLVVLSVPCLPFALTCQGIRRTRPARWKCRQRRYWCCGCHIRKCGVPDSFHWCCRHGTRNCGVPCFSYCSCRYQTGSRSVPCFKGQSISCILFERSLEVFPLQFKAKECWHKNTKTMNENMTINIQTFHQSNMHRTTEKKGKPQKKYICP